MSNGMRHGADEWQATRRSLLTRLRDAGDQTGWQEFFETYWKLLYRVARRSGLTDAEAQDAVQETIITVAQQMPKFRYEPARCSFKGWLLLLTRQRIAHQFRKRNKPGGEASRVHAGAVAHALSQAGAGGTPALLSGDVGPATVDQLPEAGSPGFEAIWDEEWQQHLFSAALERVKRQVSDRQFQIFDLHTLQNWSVREVARTLRVSSAQVYLAKHRVSAVLKRELKQAERELISDAKLTERS
jgi:RNA polymerase sigma-70 factor (ECF subfamily)